MKKSNESYLHYLKRCISGLMRDEDDRRYWSGVFGMTGAACLAVAFIEQNAYVLIVGMVCCIYGLRFHRKEKTHDE
jgi:hypothetical protein